MLFSYSIGDVWAKVYLFLKPVSKKVIVVAGNGSWDNRAMQI